MLDVGLLDVAKVTALLVDRTAVAPGDLVAAQLALPLPGDSLALGDSAYSVTVSWRVALTNPPVNTDGFLDTTQPAPTYAVAGRDYIAPAGQQVLSPVFALRPAIAGAGSPPTRSYWLVAEFTLRTVADLTLNPTAVVELTRARVSPQIAATGLSGIDLEQRVGHLWKVEIPAVPVQPGAPLAARLRLRGAEDAAWDVESATDITPKLDLAANVQVDALFAPLDRIIGKIFGAADEVLAGGVQRVTQPYWISPSAFIASWTFGRAPTRST